MTLVSAQTLRKAVQAIEEAEIIFIGAGAGMGVDSGLPDFRGDEGFWEAYPPMKEAGLSFRNIANPHWFNTDSSKAWGFYGHRLNLYRDITPHAGFEILRQWCAEKEYYIFTSNVDGQFQKAGFSENRIVEIHGSIHHLQCMEPYVGNPDCSEIWSAQDVHIKVDAESFLAQGELPVCPSCRGVARPNILMFGDYDFVETRTGKQESMMWGFIQSYPPTTSVAVIEFGAGCAIPTVRYQCERVSRHFNAPLIRINPRDSHGPEDTISIPLGALEGVSRMLPYFNPEEGQ